MASQDYSQKIRTFLTLKGLVASGDLLRELGVSRDAMARHIKKVSGLVSVGQTRNLQYGLLRPYPDLPSELPLFRVDSEGQVQPLGILKTLHNNFFVAQPGDQVFNALPPEISDMAPQGFMGRAFARRFELDLQLPPRLQDWSDTHILRAVARRGEDLPGNLLVGRESAERWQTLVPQHSAQKDWLACVRQALADQPQGSSAGGEQPKFSTFARGQHYLVKFAGPVREPAQRRWQDLLHCEFLAGQVLQKAGFAVAHSRIVEQGDFTFLEIARFDRAHEKGRLPYLSLAAADAFHFGDRDDWSSAALRLQRGGFIDSETARRIRLVDAFARLIADTDRHFYNLGFFPTFESPGLLRPVRYALAPLFDKLPMRFAPQDGRILEATFTPPLPDAPVMDVWREALDLARVFWRRVSLENSISAGFRQIAKKCLTQIV